MASKAPPPSTGAPAGVPPSGNGKYIALAVLLLGAIGVVVVIKLTSKPPEPPPLLVDAAPPPPPSTNKDDDIPLPPPVEDAGPEDAGKKPATTYTMSNQCDVKKCGGKASGDLETALAFRAKQAHRCYDNALAQDPTLRGKVGISVRVGANGQVCNAGVATNEMQSSNVASCVAGYFRGQTFPAPRGGCVDINIPINFVPRQ